MFHERAGEHGPDAFDQFQGDQRLAFIHPLEIAVAGSRGKLKLSGAPIPPGSFVLEWEVAEAEA